jgi:hypothetical protein
MIVASGLGLLSVRLPTAINYSATAPPSRSHDLCLDLIIVVMQGTLCAGRSVAYQLRRIRFQKAALINVCPFFVFACLPDSAAEK